MRAEPFHGGPLAEALGLLHDLGKEKPAFQRRLVDPSIAAPHAAEGARAIAQLGSLGPMLAAAVAGHHGRLPDPDRLKERLAVAEEIALPDWCDVRPLAPTDHLRDGANQGPAYRAQFLVRMLYGALTDADDRETNAFYAEAEGREMPQRREAVGAAMRDAFDMHMAGLGGTGAVNDLRREVLAHARAMAKAEPGLFTLTVPTGGGKTLTSLGFALDHALRHGLRRLIYVIPYTSIVEQTADAYREVFGALGQDVVLEHHANADWDGEDENEGEQRRIMGASWDVPIVVTTAVQFFESLHAARKKRCRKLPSLARSVIVLDETQTMPLPLLRPCLAALSELMEGYGASVVLSTATQPSLTKAGGFPAPEALEGAREIAPDPDDLFERLKRVEVRDVGALDDAALAERLRAELQVLLIVDNRMQARTVFDAVRDAPGARHLSTLMTPDHRRAVLRDVRADLKDGRPVRLVATSLIEAGVDVDFPLVLRAAAGIDSVAQAAGRCNREGRRDMGRVEIFRSEHAAPPAVEQFAEIGRKVLATHGDDPIGRSAVAAYFARLWEAYGCEKLDAAEVGETVQTTGILKAIEGWGRDCQYETLERAFRMIPDAAPSVAIVGGTHGVDPEELEALRFGAPGPVARLLRPNTASLPFGLWRDLRAAGLVTYWAEDRFETQFPVLTSEEHYDDAAGIRVANLKTLNDTVI